METREQTKVIKLDSLKVNIHQEHEGEWIAVKSWPRLGELPGLEFKVRSTNDPEYVTAKANQQIRLAQKYGLDTPPIEEMSRTDGQLAADYLLLDWKGLSEAYSPEFAKSLLISPEGRNVLGMIFWCADRVGKREIEFLEISEKN